MFTTESRWKRKTGPVSAFVRKSACCCSDYTATMSNSPLNTSSRRKWCLMSMRFEFDAHTGLWARCLAPLLSSKTVMHAEPRPGKIKLHTYRKKIISSMVSASATYSASVVESVTHLWVLENQHMHAPAHMTAPPETDLLSVVLLT